MNGPCLVMVAQDRGPPQRKLSDKQNGPISFSFSCFPFDEIETPNKLRGLVFVQDLYRYWVGQTNRSAKVPREINICITVVTARDRYVVSCSFTSHGVSSKVLHDQQNVPFLGINKWQHTLLGVVWPGFKPRDPLLHANVPIINRPGRLFLFTSKIEVSIVSQIIW